MGHRPALNLALALLLGLACRAQEGAPPASAPTAPPPVPSVERPLAPAQQAAPVFEALVSELSPALRAEMTGVSWSESVRCGKGVNACPDFDDLRLLTLDHWTLEGGLARGELVVHREAAEALVEVFRSLFEARFPIAKMRRIDHYGGSDDASMADDNTSAFNCRCTTGGDRLSEHAFGRAVDVNPVENPFVAGKRVAPPAGRAFLERQGPGVIVEEGPVVRAFEAAGWRWGGRWRSAKDYQHFSESGR